MLTKRKDSAREAAALLDHRRQRASPPSQDSSIKLQKILDEQCSANNLTTVSVSEFDTYLGPDPESVYCDEIIAYGAIVFRLDRVNRVWVRPAAAPH